MSVRQYRGKRKDNGEWVKGYLVEFKDMSIIFESGDFLLICDDSDKSYSYIPSDFWVQVDPATVSQGSGKFDINNKEVFAGDKSKGHGVCVFTTDGIEGTTGFYWKNKEGIHHYEYLTTPVEIIGNIYTEQDNAN